MKQSGGVRRTVRIGVKVAMIAMLGLVVAPLGMLAQEDAPAESTASVVYLVRHAEKAEGDPADPLLSAAGTERAELVARMLADVPLTNIFSTPYRRTMNTAEPSAHAHGLEILPYDPSSRDEMMGLIETLRTTPGHHLVVGHSNTTPGLVQALGGDPLSPIDEEEYDRLYIVTIGADGSVSSSMVRFGRSFEGAEAHAGG